MSFRLRIGAVALAAMVSLSGCAVALVGASAVGNIFSDGVTHRWYTGG